MPYRDPPEFYAPWPLFGKKISFQWDNIRKDTETLKVLSRSLNFDENITKYIDSAVAGYEYGEDGFHNRFRTFYDKDTNNWILQFNTGTEASPTWVNYVTVNSIGTVTFQGAFYTATLDVSAGGDLGPVPPTVTNVRHLIFHTDNFYITTNSLSQPVVNVKALGDIKGATNLPGGSGIFAQKSGENLEFKSLTGGGNIVITPLADTIGITSTAIGTITGIQSAGGTNTLSAGVSGNDVTVKGLTAGPGILLTSDAVSVTIESTATGGGGGFYGIGVVQSDDKQGYSGINVLSFEASNFYIKRNSTDPDKVQINFRPTAGTAGAGTITGGTSLGGTEPVFAGTVAPNLTFKGITAGTGISLGSDANSITVTNTGPTLAQIGPGFYGIGVIQSDNTKGYSGINTLSFEVGSFYLKRSTTDRDKVQIGLRPPAVDASHVTLPTSGSPTPSGLARVNQFFHLGFSGTIVTGCDITDNGDGTVSITAGEVAIRNAATDNAYLATYAVAAKTNWAMTDLDVNYLYIDYAGGALTWTIGTTTTDYNGMDKMQAFTVSRNGTLLSIVDARGQTRDGNRKTRRMLLEWDGFIYSGFEHSAGGTVISASTLALVLTAGKFYYGLAPNDHIAFDTSVAGIANANVFRYFYKRSEPWTQIADQKNINVTQYDNAGTLTTMIAGRWRTDWVYLIMGDVAMGANSGARLAVILGNTQYTSQALAEAEAIPAVIPAYLDGTAIPIGQIVVQKSAATMSVRSSLTSTFALGTPTVHNTLGGLQGGTTNEYFHLTAAELNLAQNVGPGFYGIGVVQSDNQQGYSGINTLSFEASSFYLKRSTTDRDKVQINFRGTAGGGAGTITGGTALGGTEPVYATTTSPTINFKGLTAGAGISLTSDANQINIIATGTSGSDPGFYGITAIQSDGKHGYKNLNVLSFEASNFYLTRNTTDPDKVQINLRPAAGAAGGGTVTGGASLGGDQAIYDSTAGPTMSFKGVSAGTGISLSSSASAVTITNTGPTLAQIGPGFYGIGVVQSDDKQGYSGINTLSFEVANFYLKRSTTDLDKVQINLRPAPAATVVSGTALGGDQAVFAGLVVTALTFKGITAGTGISLGSDASAITITNTGPTLAQIGPGFYGIGVIQSDNKQGYSGINTLSFEAANFYIKRNVTDPDKVQISLRPTAGTGSGTITAGTSLGGTEAVYGTTTAPTINFKGLTAGTGISLGSDANSITVTNTGPTLANIGPGFYGIGVVQSDNKQGYSGINTLSFEASAFYIKRNATDPDKVQIGFRPTQGTVGSGTITGGTSLGGTEAVYGTTTAPTINFKGLTAGTGITLSSDANAITINSTGGASDPGFYGITVMQSDGLQSARGVNTIKFLSDNFYIKQHPGDTDEVTVNFREKRYDILESISFQFDYPVLEHYFLDSYAFFPYTVEAVNLVTQSGQAQVGFYIRNPLEGYERNPGISIQGLDPYLVQANRFRDTQYSTGNNVVNIGQELILAVFYLNQNPKAIRGSVRIRRPNAV